MSKKNKKEQDASPAPGREIPSVEGPPSRAGFRRKAWIAVAAGAALAVAALGVAASLPGHRDPDQEFMDCYHRIGLVSTALLRWERTHPGRFPDSIRELQDAGLLTAEPDFLMCPATRQPYAYYPGLRPDMPGSAILVSCPECASHAEPRPDQAPSRVVLLVGADLRIRWERGAESSIPGGKGKIVWAKVKRRLEVQARIPGLLERLARGDAAARAELALLPVEDGGGPLGVWAMGASGDRAFLPLLAGRRRMSQAMESSGAEAPDEEDLALARASLRLGDASATPLLIRFLDGANASLREQARAALEEAFRDAKPPLPKLRSYLPAGVVEGEKEALDAWWAQTRAKGR